MSTIARPPPDSCRCRRFAPSAGSFWPARLSVDASTASAAAAPDDASCVAADWNVA